MPGWTLIVNLIPGKGGGIETATLEGVQPPEILRQSCATNHGLRVVQASTAETRYTALDFFAGSGLVTQALAASFDVLWANDLCAKKAAVYRANHPDGFFNQGAIEAIRGKDLPTAPLSWASFPCQDLSLAGNIEGIHSSRSGLVWHWLRVMDEMIDRPKLLVAENVTGLISAGSGHHYRRLHQELTRRGYRVGAVVLDAARWVPQSRPRVFVVAVSRDIPTGDLESTGPLWCHPLALQKAAADLDDWIWWRLPEPGKRTQTLETIVDFEAPCDSPQKRDHNLSLIPPRHVSRLQQFIAEGHRIFPGYKRTRNRHQVLELRFDGVAGCLRTPEGGSSRQLLVLQHGDGLETRLLTIRETAALMGAPSAYKLPGSYNEAYRAMGDAVAVPVVEHLTRHLLSTLAGRA